MVEKAGATDIEGSYRVESATFDYKTKRTYFLQPLVCVPSESYFEVMESVDASISHGVVVVRNSCKAFVDVGGQLTTPGLQISHQNAFVNILVEAEVLLQRDYQILHRHEASINENFLDTRLSVWTDLVFDLSSKGFEFVQSLKHNFLWYMFHAEVLVDALHLGL